MTLAGEPKWNLRVGPNDVLARGNTRDHDPHPVFSGSLTNFMYCLREGFINVIGIQHGDLNHARVPLYVL